MKVWLLTVEDALDGAGNLVTLRFCDQEYKTSGEPYVRRIKELADFKAGVSGTFLPVKAEPGFGIASLSNKDGKLDYLVDYALDGRVAKYQLADVATYPDTYATTIDTVIHGTILGHRDQKDAVEIVLRDPLE